MRRSAHPRASARARTNRSTISGPGGGPGEAPAAQSAQPDVHNELRALSAAALHMTVYDLLAHAYNRVAIQYYRDEGAALLGDLRRYPPTLFTPALPPTLQREVVAALLADSARALATFFGFEEMNFILLDHEQSVYRLAVREGVYFPHFQAGIYTQPFGTGLLGQCHLERRTVLVNDVSQSEHYVSNDPAVHAELCVPVLLGEEVLAIIDSGAYLVGAFTPAHATFIEGFARYLAPAIADPLAFLQSWRPGLAHGGALLAPLAQSLNFLYSWHEEWRSRFAQLYTELAQRNAELLTLIDLGAALGTSLRLETILATTVAKVAQLLACQVSWVLLPDDAGRLHIRALHGGLASGLAEAGIAPDASPQSTVFVRGEALITNDVASVPRSSFDWAFCRRNQITRYATVPLRVRERTIGVMNVGRTHPGAELTEQDVRLLSTFASQIALAIENASLYEHSRLLGAAEERARLARDLHDTLAQSMLTILRALEGIEAEAGALPDTLRERLTATCALARQSLDEARRSVWNLQPAALDHASLREALAQHVTTWSAQTGVRAKFEQRGHPIALGPGIEAELLHIVREALHNAARHAAASLATVTLQFSPAGLRLTIADDGAGFDAPALMAERAGEPVPAAAPLARDHGGGLGLRGMRERARLLGAWLQIESSPGWGTRVVLTIPHAALEHAARAQLATRVLPDFIASEMPPPASADAPASAAPTSAAPASSAAAPDNALATDGIGEHAPAPPADAVISVLLADDHPALRAGLHQALERIPGLRLVGSAASAREAIEQARTLRPAILLLDMQLPDADGLTVLRQLGAEALPTRVIIFTAHGDDANLAAALQAGAAGYLRKDLELPRLVEAIRAAALGRQVFSPAIATRLQSRAGLLVNVRAGQLTPREQEVLALLAAGMRYRAIAQRLCVAEATIKFHVLNLYQKLQSSSRVEALNRAREWGLLR